VSVSSSILYENNLSNPVVGCCGPQILWFIAVFFIVDVGARMCVIMFCYGAFRNASCVGVFLPSVIFLPLYRCKFKKATFGLISRLLLIGFVVHCVHIQ
jgi:hypothetical protein